MIRCHLFLVAMTLLLGVSSAAGSCQDFTIGSFGPDTIDNENYCSGACIAAGDVEGDFSDEGGYKCDCLDGSGSVTLTLCDETANGDRSSVAASNTEESGAVSKDHGITLLFGFVAGWFLFGGW